MFLALLSPLKWQDWLVFFVILHIGMSLEMSIQFKSIHLQKNKCMYSCMRLGNISLAKLQVINYFYHLLCQWYYLQLKLFRNLFLKIIIKFFLLKILIRPIRLPLSLWIRFFICWKNYSTKLIFIGDLPFSNLILKIYLSNLVRMMIESGWGADYMLHLLLWI